ncbi:protein PRRC2A-like [Schistocerca serialis cubense]|uniref:protein PRRC2A-like n=1 Tax=Schistocerca serialis cubense TaxID=2023355 RepID=UPI00214E5BAF|nr:protein PRRC2A-like [Schistocerca serialis cubense]
MPPWVVPPPKCLRGAAAGLPKCGVGGPGLASLAGLGGDPGPWRLAHWRPGSLSACRPSRDTKDAPGPYPGKTQCPWQRRALMETSLRPGCAVVAVPPSGPGSGPRFGSPGAAAPPPPTRPHCRAGSYGWCPGSAVQCVAGLA